MTENEIKKATIEDAIYCAKAMACLEVCEECRFYGLCHTWCDDVYGIMIEALEEVKAYRAIGTVEDLKTMKENGAFTGVELAQILAMQMELKKYQSIGTVEEFKGLKDKAETQKVDEDDCCPICHTYGKDDNGVTGNYCPECGQALDWK